LRCVHGGGSTEGCPPKGSPEAGRPKGVAQEGYPNVGPPWGIQEGCPVRGVTILSTNGGPKIVSMGSPRVSSKGGLPTAAIRGHQEGVLIKISVGSSDRCPPKFVLRGCYTEGGLPRVSTNGGPPRRSTEGVHQVGPKRGFPDWVNKRRRSRWFAQMGSDKGVLSGGSPKGGPPIGVAHGELLKGGPPKVGPRRGSPKAGRPFHFHQRGSQKECRTW
jgi:hypothetical protein